MEFKINLNDKQTKEILEIIKDNEGKIEFLKESNVIQKAYGNTLVNFQYYSLKVQNFMSNFVCKKQNTGYKYLIDALIICLNNESYLKNLNSLLYPILADKHQTTITNIERNIRYTVKQIFDYNSESKLTDIFGKNLAIDDYRKPTTSEFLNLVVTKLKLE